MERLLFDSIITNEERIKQLENLLERMQTIRYWEVKRIPKGTIIIIEALQMFAFELGLALTNKGYPVERVYEE